jgi:hypothetical protein
MSAAHNERKKATGGRHASRLPSALFHYCNLAASAYINYTTPHRLASSAEGGFKIVDDEGRRRWRGVFFKVSGS